tara:strand:- start:371 stop:1306 length:936 start_codon:yes stop_codon:yes gene_type:complete
MTEKSIDDRCVTQSYSGISHDYRKCTNDYEDVLDDGLMNSAGSMNADGPKAVFSGMLTFATAFTGNPAGSIKSRCKGILGNKYFIKQPAKCSNDRYSNEYIHKWINNVQTYNPFTGQTSKTPLGLIPSVIGSVASVRPSALLDAITNSPSQPCIKVDLPCHVIYFKKEKDEFTANLSGPDDASLDVTNESPSKTITLEQFDRILIYGGHGWNEAKKQEYIALRNEILKEEEARKANKESFTNINNNDSIYQSIYKYLESNKELLNFQYDENTIKKKNINSFNNKIIFDIYYITLFAFLIFLILKISNKKLI